MIDDIFGEEFEVENDLVAWIMNTRNEWKDHYIANYDKQHREYYRLWRAIWAEEDKMRESERSKLIAPAVQQAVESSVAEVEEATFSSGQIFDIDDNYGDQDLKDVELMRNKLREDFAKAKIRSTIGECLINAAVYGQAVAEIVLEESVEYVPSTVPMMEGDLEQVGTSKVTRPIVRLNPAQPQQTIIDPSATNVDDGQGCFIEQFVSPSNVELLVEAGVYNDVDLGIAPPDDNMEANPEDPTQPENRVKLLKYFGLVPTAALKAAGAEVEDGDALYTEAIVVVANDGELLKAIENPYMCKDRPLVSFSWDIVPGRFWGRGVVEKGYMSQKALDAELRARIDALALTTHPMMAVDSGRVPRGTKFEIRPGKMFLTSGNPAEILQPFKFGQVDQITFQQAASLQGMVQQATGAVDSAGMAQGAAADGTLGGMAMSLGAIIKRQKRTLLNFQESFLLPFVKKAATRYMQFDPENYPVQDFNFTAVSSLGVVAREYEIGQLSQALQTLQAGTPEHAAVMKGIIEHLSISNREEIVGLLEQSGQPDPRQQEMAEQKFKLEQDVLMSQIELLQSQAAESKARAEKYSVEAALAPEELVGKYADTDNDGKMDADFERRMAVADLHLRERDMQLKEKTAENNEQDKQKANAEAELIRQLTAGG
ncbi:MAG: hypothetical protein HRU12_08910 [Phaeodactylibacter sp.]|nr:hypothetical protein [Phaeodactylibacter sp.]